MSVLPTWVQWTQALAVPAIAFAGVLVAASNYILALRRREDELFDRRLAFYERVRQKFVDSQRRERTAGDTHWRQASAEEARFLFGEDIADHIVSYRTPLDEQWIGDDHIPSGFVRPFRKYMDRHP